MLEEEAVGQVSALPGRGAAARSSAPRRDIEDASEGEEDYDDAAAASPPKVRRIQKDTAPARATKGKETAAVGKKAAARPPSRGTARGAGKTRSSGRRRDDSASEEEEEGSEEGEDSGSEGGGGKAGMIELDDEEAAALANLDLHDEVDDDESYEA